MKKHGLGWLPDVPDARDVPFASVFKVPKKLPPRADLRPGCSPVEDQGALGSCTAQALAGALEYLELRTLRAPLPSGFRDLSRLFVYYNERAAMGTVNEDSGAMLRIGIKTLARLGVCREDLWPYRISQFTRKPAKACYAQAQQHKVTAYQRLTQLAEMKACLAMGLPFVFGFSVYEHVVSAAVAKTGVLRMPQPGERLLGGHAILAVGYDDARQRLLFRNSWGAGWGQQGYGEMPYAYLETRSLSDDFWSIQETASNVYALALRR
jgi:C1A family cysteine protease